jgi:predicted enzyme related to lactoylglutathione lyase
MAENTHPIAVGYVIIDCQEPETLSSFWASLLNVEIGFRRGPYVFLKGLPNGLGMGFQRVPEHKAGKNRVHIDLVVHDVVDTAARVEALGGQRLPGYEAGGFLVMADPEGNEFCVLPPTFDMDEHGNVHYLVGNGL